MRDETDSYVQNSGKSVDMRNEIQNNKEEKNTHARTQAHCEKEEDRSSFFCIITVRAHTHDSYWQDRANESMHKNG